MVTASQAITNLLRFQSAYENILAQRAASREFSNIVEELDWAEHPPEFFSAVISMAITLEMTRLARELANRGHELYPEDKSLAQAAYVLAPPRVIKRNLPPVPNMSKSMEWLNEHAYQYSNIWLAVLNGELLKTASSHRELLDQLGEIAENPALLVTKVP